jgi:hypothetical protein
MLLEEKLHTSALGNNQYEIRFTFYRDCHGISATPQMSLTIDNSCGYPQNTVNMNALPSSPAQISPICPLDTTECNGGSYTGLEEWVYIDTITLPGPCNDWTFSHTESARNSAITTLSGAGNFICLFRFK